MELGAAGSKRSPEGTGRMLTTDSFEYYMVRIRRFAGEPGQLSGQVERLGTGEKCGFGSGQDLVRLVANWPERPSELQSDTLATQPLTGTQERTI
jgi:hypothetical protein